MRLIRSPEVASEEILKNAKTILSILRKHTESPPKDLKDAIVLLHHIRKDVYEDLNQQQHAYWVLKAIEWLQNEDLIPNTAQMYWNPNQTGDETEPDLAVVEQGIRIIAAEVTTSVDPQGQIDRRMALTLQKLEFMSGKQKYYFVQSKKMEARAKTKIKRGDFDIKAVLLAD